MNAAIIGAITVIAVFVIQELGSFLLNKVFTNAGNRIPSILSFVRNKKISDFYSVKNTDEYKTFEYDYLKEYYGEEFFTKTKKGLIPVFTVKYSGDSEDSIINSIRDYDKLGDKTDVDFSFDPIGHQSYKKAKHYKKYHYLVSSKIKAPDRPGFMLDKIECNEAGQMTGFRGYVGTYAENVYTNHVLEYELYRLFLKRGKKSIKEQCRLSEVRNGMHKSTANRRKDEKYSELMRQSLCTGEGRQSLLSVQMMVLINNGEDYCIKVIQRSNDVAVAPERFQLVPSGGFEILNDSISGYSMYEIEDNYSSGCAVFREYLEEIFGNDEFEGKGAGSVNEVLMKDERIREIESLLKEGKAEFRFLGSVLDLAGLRHELSFVLIVHDAEYNNNKFIGNEECKSKIFISNVTLHNFEQREDIWENLHGPSAAMWELFKATDIYERLMK